MNNLTLPGMPEPSPAFEAPKRSAGQRMTERQSQDVRKGRHPLTGGTLHNQADTTARKCDLSTITHGQATDVRAWWPACPRWEDS